MQVGVPGIPMVSSDPESKSGSDRLDRIWHGSRHLVAIWVSDLDRLSGGEERAMIAPAL